MDTPRLEDIRAARETLGERVRTTPLWAWDDDRLADRVGGDTRVELKLELFQVGGTFKPRGALLNALALDEGSRERGVTAVSAGNHAIAIAIAASGADTHAKVVMPESADPFRVERCRALGAEVVLVKDVHEAFDTVKRIETDEGRSFIHPFEGERTFLGTATVALEWVDATAGLDAVILPIGGGGLAAGMASCFAQAMPGIRIYGVEPEGADTMRRSFAAGEPQAIDQVHSIADSLGAPHAAPMSYALCRRHIDELVTVSDEQLVDAMRLIHRSLSLAVEPACAAATAALLGPLRDTLAGQRVGVLFCGSNISPERWLSYVGAAPERP